MSKLLLTVQQLNREQVEELKQQYMKKIRKSE